MKKILIIILLMNNVATIAQDAGHLKVSPSNKEIVRAFLEEVRSGKGPEGAPLFMAERVIAHQLNAENEVVVERTPQNYANHVREFLVIYGAFTFEITELLADGDKVYARWKQTGNHLTTLDGYEPTGKPLVEIASATYRLVGGKIVEYWIQVDRYGMEEQLKRQAVSKR
ncbi:ester cyclase [Telluribacter humicola]|uniref:ester cyclase n=1 Tax=Telluribacter humicola TaxID=1720261 RepID=UPI001A96541C|nr:ester cyclase [Telluribacter humicola]